MSIFKCEITYNKIPNNSKISTKNKLVAHGFLEESYEISNDNFYKASRELNLLASNKLGKDVNLYQVRNNVAIPNTEVFTEIDSINNKVLQPNILDNQEGIDYVFQSNPELTNIGTKKQYSEYIKTIFPDSKVKDIVYHGTDNDNFKTFYRNLYSGIHFGTLNQAKGRRNATDTDFKNNAKFISVVINHFNPFITKDHDWEQSNYLWTSNNPDDFESLEDIDFTETLFKEKILINREDYQDYNGNFDILKQKKYSGVIYKNIGRGENTGENSYAVFEPEQIHILGNKQDQEMFSNFVNNISEINQEKNLPVEESNYNFNLPCIKNNI
jgi:hypothetical protein